MHAPGVCERKATTVNNKRILKPYMRSILFPVQKKKTLLPRAAACRLIFFFPASWFNSNGIGERVPRQDAQLVFHHSLYCSYYSQHYLTGSEPLCKVVLRSGTGPLSLGCISRRSPSDGGALMPFLDVGRPLVFELYRLQTSPQRSSRKYLITSITSQWLSVAPI